eukprot:NODE_781_length_3919_cov_1.323037.p2 type:complete len:286 gc:universal NODE_781_length_3919_cov_1.323037:1660-803(-)
MQFQPDILNPSNPTSPSSTESKSSHRLPQVALKELESLFQQTHYPTHEEMEHIGSKYDIKAAKIKNWFNNRKSKEKRLQNKEEARKVRELDISKMLFSTKMTFNKQQYDLSDCYQLDWGMFIAMRNRLFELQTNLAKLTGNETLISDQIHYSQNKLILQIYQSLSDALQESSEILLREFHLQLNSPFSEVFAIFPDIKEMQLNPPISKSVDFKMHGNHIYQSYFGKKFKEIGTLKGKVKMAIQNQLKNVLMGAKMMELTAHYYKDLKTLELCIKVQLFPNYGFSK